MSRTLTSIVPNDLPEGYKRLDVFISETFGISRSQVQKAIKAGLVSVGNQIILKANFRLKAGQMVSFSPLPVAESTLEPEEIPLEILYEDQDVIVVNKPSGLVVHPAPGHNQGTLVNALLAYCHDLSGIGGVKRPGIVHRLDKDTSGVLIIAKNDRSHQTLTQQFKDRLIKKEYICLVLGSPKKAQGQIDFPIGRHPTDRKRFSIHTKKPRQALTLWQKERDYGYCALLHCFPKTGRTHQIRVHLTAIGHPILGDPIYLKKSRLNKINNKALKELLRQTPRLMLHAFKISFIHPTIQKTIIIEAPIPQDMQDMIQKIEDIT